MSSYPRILILICRDPRIQILISRDPRILILKPGDPDPDFLTYDDYADPDPDLILLENRIRILIKKE